MAFPPEPMPPELTDALLEGLPKNGPTDPIQFYRRPLVGWLFRERINRGLRLLPARRFERVLEVGYAAGAVQLALSPSAGELHGLDLDADPAPVGAMLAARGCHPKLLRGNVYDLPYATGTFDLVVCFSVFEHLDRYRRAVEEVARVLTPGGLFLLGMPAVRRAMDVAFRAIGFRGIGHHHVTTPADVEAHLGLSGLRVLRSAHLDFPLEAPLGMRLYYDWLLEKRADGEAFPASAPLSGGAGQG